MREWQSSWGWGGQRILIDKNKTVDLKYYKTKLKCSKMQNISLWKDFESKRNFCSLNKVFEYGINERDRGSDRERRVENRKRQISSQFVTSKEINHSSVFFLSLKKCCTVGETKTWKKKTFVSVCVCIQQAKQKSRFQVQGPGCVSVQRFSFMSMYIIFYIASLRHLCVRVVIDPVQFLFLMQLVVPKLQGNEKKGVSCLNDKGPLVHNIE